MHDHCTKLRWARRMSGKQDVAANPRLDEAARAGWLYYIAGNTQDQIASKLGISRQTAQRLVSLAVSEGLIKVRVDHPIANCLDLAARLPVRRSCPLPYTALTVWASALPHGERAHPGAHEPGS